MLGNAGKYDPQIARAVTKTVLNGNKSRGKTFSTKRDVSFSDLRIGDVLVSNIETADSKVLFSKGSTVSQLILSRLQGHIGIHGKIKESIYIRSS